MAGRVIFQHWELVKRTSIYSTRDHWQELNFIWWFMANMFVTIIHLKNAVPIRKVNADCKQGFKGNASVAGRFFSVIFQESLEKLTKIEFANPLDRHCSRLWNPLKSHGSISVVNRCGQCHVRHPSNYRKYCRRGDHVERCVCDGAMQTQCTGKKQKHHSQIFDFTFKFFPIGQANIYQNW